VAGKKEKIFVFGASGHAKVVIDIIEKQGLYDIAFLVDDDLTLLGQEFFGHSVVGGKEDLLASIADPLKGVVAIGNNRARRSVASWLEGHGFELIPVIHPSVQLGRDVEVGSGTVVMANAVINSSSTIGENVIINTRASVDHDCRVGDGVHIAPGATLCGSVTVGEGSFVAAGATVIPNLTIGRDVTVGAGAVVIRDVPDGATVVGNPARQIS